MKTRIRDIILPFLLLFLGGCAWETAVRFWEIPAYILPAPLEILEVILVRREILMEHALVTLAEIGAGFMLALIVGVVAGILIHSSKLLERALLPLVIASQTIPVFAIAPLLVLWFGYGIGSKVVMAAIIVFFPIVINTVEGLRAADRDLIDMLTIMEASQTQIFFKVRVPQALPFLFAGVKIGIAVSVIGAVIGEWVGAQKGLGFLMVHANAQLQVGLVFAAIGCLSALGVGLYGLVSLVERKVVYWRTDRGRSEVNQTGSKI